MWLLYRELRSVSHALRVLSACSVRDLEYCVSTELKIPEERRVPITKVGDLRVVTGDWLMLFAAIYIIIGAIM